MSDFAKGFDRAARLSRLLTLLLLLGVGPACAVKDDTDQGPPQLAAGEPLNGCAAAGEHINRREAWPSRRATPPGLQAWEANMVSYGERLGRALMSEATSYQKRLNLQYYDAQRVFFQIADYTGDAEQWRPYAEAAETVYKRYLEENDFRAAGYMVFPHGLYLDWKRTGDHESRQYLLKLREKAAFATPELPTYRRKWADARFSREIAYGLQTQILAERAGAPRQSERVQTYVELALGHVETWLTGNYRHDEPKWKFCQSFMAGLTASALIDYDDHLAATGRPRDPRIQPRLEALADWLWRTMWVPGVGNGNKHWYAHANARLGAFEYIQPSIEGVGSEEPAPDMNMLIAPLYGWLYDRTGDERFRNRGDAIFAGGVGLAALSRGKPFNQSYRASFDYVAWRRNGIEAETTTASTE